MTQSQFPSEFALPTEPTSVTEQAICHLAGSDGFDDPILSRDEDEHVIQPVFDVEVRPHRYLITMRLPKFRCDEVAVAVMGNEVLVYGKHAPDAAGEGNASAESFSKSFRLPNWIDLNSADATIHEGMLRVAFLRTVQPGLRYVPVREGVRAW